MVTLRRIGVGSAFRVGFLFALATSVVNIAFAIFWLVFINGVPLSVLPPEIWGQLAFNIALSSLVMALGIGFFALMYNLGFGGLKLEFDVPSTPAEKRKNDDFEEIEIE